jgi:hypothetical protein
MNILSMNIADIHPGDFPRESSWEHFSSCSDERIIRDFSRMSFELALLPTVGWILREGSHRVARLYQVGISQINYLPIVLTKKDTRSWQQRIDALHGKRIYTFEDFLNQCQAGRFYR